METETKQPEQERTATVIVQRVSTGETVHRERVAAGDVGALIDQLARERGDAQGGEALPTRTPARGQARSLNGPGRRRRSP
jgi:hypothetical protein